MKDRKIESVGGHHNSGGMAHLIEQSNEGNRAKEKQAEMPPWPEGKCLKMRCILEGIDYYIPEGRCAVQVSEPPYCPFAFEVGYSPVLTPGFPSADPVSIIKHENKRFYQTGISTEIVDLPAWWSKKDGM